MYKPIIQQMVNYKFFTILYLFVFTIMTYAQKTNSTLVNIIQNNNTELSTINQLIVVYNQQTNDNKAVLYALEKKNESWIVKYGPIDACIGRNGFALPNEKHEGDGKSPYGFFSFGQLFSYRKKIKTTLPFIQTTSDDKWIDDPTSDAYNTYLRGETNAKSYENLLLKSDAYKYCMVINYNTTPIVKGKGSAIFFHVGQQPTAGCVAISEKNMVRILKWMKKKYNPSILMGTIEELLEGNKPH